MAAYEPQRIRIAAAHLPSGAELLIIEKPYRHAAVGAADIDGDGHAELAAAYRLGGELYVLVLHHRDGVWSEARHTKGLGYGVSQMAMLPVMRAGKPNLTVGWQIAPNRSKLSVYEWSQDGLFDVAPANLQYSFMETMDMHPFRGEESQVAIALWSHVANGAYQIEVLRWNQDQGQFSAAPETYAGYFPGVVRYYEQLTRQHPAEPFYWYYLADAQFRAGQSQPALASIYWALGFANPRSREPLLALERNIRDWLEPIPVPRAPGLYPAPLQTASGTRWGYIDSSGRMSIQPRFDDAMDFQPNGLAVVAEHGQFGLIDKTAHYIVQPMYDSIGSFSEGRAVVIDKQGFKLIDEKGNVLTKRAYPFLAELQNGRALFYVTTGGGDQGGEIRYGYLDAQGNEVIPAQFAEANDFHADKAVVKIRDNEYALIGTDGRILVTYAYAYVGSPGDGLLAFQKEASGKYGYIDERGHRMLQPAYTSAFPFHEGRAIVNTGADFAANYGVIDKQGSFIVKAGYNDIRDLGQTRLALGRPIDAKQPFIGSMYAIADWNGKRLTNFLYHDVSDYKNGLASATDTKETYFIDRSGKPAAGYPRVDGNGTLTIEQGGLIRAFVDQRLSYLTRDGRIVWKQNTVIPLRPPYLVKELKYKPNPDYLVYYPEVEGIASEAAQQALNAKLKNLSQVKPVPADQQLEAAYTGDFEVSFFKQQLLELKLTGYNFPFGAAHGMPTQIYAVIDLTNGRLFELADLFKPGSDYVKVLSDIVGEQIKGDPQYAYVFPDTYHGISPDQPFFVTGDALHLYFQPYDIAPYVAGFPTFTIPFSQIMSLIDTQGAFWKSFHA